MSALALGGMPFEFPPDVELVFSGEAARGEAIRRLVQQQGGRRGSTAASAARPGARRAWTVIATAATALRSTDGRW